MPSQSKRSAYSLELLEAERLWPLVNEPLANKAFESIDVVERRCRQLLQQPELIYSQLLPNEAHQRSSLIDSKNRPQ